mgnify:CR=1 FL=1
MLKEKIYTQDNRVPIYDDLMIHARIKVFAMDIKNNIFTLKESEIELPYIFNVNGKPIHFKTIFTLQDYQKLEF